MARKKQPTKPSISLEKLQLEVKETLEALGGSIEVVNASSRNGDIRFLCRVHDEEYWLKVLADFLENEGSWYSFVGKKYFMSKGKLVFGWVLIFESEEIDKTVQDIRKLFLSIHSNISPAAALADGEEPGMMEVPLPFIKGSGYDEKMQERVRPIR
jgi:hypothetical protein